MNETTKSVIFPWGATLRLSLIAFLLNFLPSEPYLTKYLKDNKHLSDEQLDNDVWPADTYASFVFLLPAGLLAERYGYRKVILGSFLIRECTRAILVFGEGVEWMAAMQVTDAASTCCNTVFFSYLYLVVAIQHFERVTAIFHATFHLGSMCGSGLGQLLVSCTAVRDDLKILFYISWAVISLSFVACIWLLPRPVRASPLSLVQIISVKGIPDAWREVQGLFLDPTVILLSVWWFFGYCTYTIIVNYYQTQFSDIDPSGAFGTVEIFIEFANFLSALGAAALSKFLLPSVYPIHIISTASIGMFLFFSVKFQTSVYESYSFNIAWMGLFSFQLAAAMATMGARLKNDRYAVLFTFNTFVALALASILQAVGNKYNFTTSQVYTMCVLVQAVGASAIVVQFIARRVRGRSLPQRYNRSDDVAASTPLLRFVEG
jgi:MFS family permease